MRAATDPIRFDDDVAFRRWVYDHPDHFVASTEVGDPAGRIEVHRASCERLAPWWVALPRDHVRYCRPNRLLLAIRVKQELGVVPREDCPCLARR